MAHQLPALPYAYNALEPHIDDTTMHIHHERHHQAYVNNLNAALEGHPGLQAMGVEDLLRQINDVPESIRNTVRNNGGGHVNHSLFWKSMGTGQRGTPKGVLADAISSTFGSFDDFRRAFTKAGASRFGSGWAWLVTGQDGKLSVRSTADQDSPYMDGQTPILGLDVWEHAYYLKYQNRRAEYISAWWNLVNWEGVSKRFAAAKG